MSEKRIVIGVFMALGAWLFLWGCNPSGCTLREKTVSINPDNFISVADLQVNLPWYCFPEFGTKAEEPDPNLGELFLAGYDHIYSDGVVCWESANHIYQGAVRFPVLETTGKKFIRSAKLIFRGSRARQLGCGVAIYLTDASDWWLKKPGGLLPASQFLQPLPSALTFSIDVTSAVEDWVYERRPNTGFLFVGSKLSFSGFSDQNMLKVEQCLSGYENFILRVTFLEKSP